MTDLSPEAKELLRKARTAFSPPAGRLEVIRSALQAQVAASHGATPSTSAASTPASGVATAGGVATRVLGAAGWGTGHTVGSALLIGALGTGGVAAWFTADRATPRASAPLEAPALALPTSTVAPPEPEEQAEVLPDPPPAENPPPAATTAPSDLVPSSKLSPLPRDRTRGVARMHSRGDPPREAPLEPSAATDSLAEEVRLLRDARSALDRGEAAPALRLLNEHEKRFRRGTLYEERLATRVQALCALGFVESARSTAQELERAAPRSPHLARVRASCIAQPPTK